MAREKLVYVLNPDGLTESIFVARGEANEGQYRGKRFTKAGQKAEKKRIQEETRAQLAANMPIQQSVPEIAPQEQTSLSYEEYFKSMSSEPTFIRQVKIQGSLAGWVGIFDEGGELLHYREFVNGFKTKDEVNSALKKISVNNNNLKYFQTVQGAVIFKGFGEIEYYNV